MKTSFSILFLLVFSLALLPAQDLKLKKAWESEAVFKTPESVVYDSCRDRLYVSNFNRFPRGEKADDCISIVDMQGRVKDLRWISGLQAPTGLYIHKKSLYVVERDGIGVYDIHSGGLKKKISIPPGGFLNDVVVDEEGNIYYTDTSPRNREESFIGRITPHIQDTLVNEGINRANGLTRDGQQLLVGNSGDFSLKCYNLETKNLQTVAVLDSGIIDGIRVFNENHYLVSHWEGRLFLVSKDGRIQELLDLRDEAINLADFEYIPQLRMLVFPTFKHGRIIAYTVE